VSNVIEVLRGYILTSYFSELFVHSSSLEAKLEESEIMLEEQESTSLNLQTQNEALARKCTRLKGYIQKLTSKCDEWASSYDKQARVMQQWMPIS
jgi:peptidoglycan hydrolase CwlO-like protein